VTTRTRIIKNQASNDKERQDHRSYTLLWITLDGFRLDQTT